MGIKAAIVACLAALAAAEADADALYGRYGYGAGLGYSGYASGLGYSGYGYAAAPYRYNGAYGYAAPATSAGITVRGYGTPATVGTNTPYGYAASGQYVADSFGAVHIPRERLRLNQRLMLMLSMEIMDMVLVTLLDTA